MARNDLINELRKELGRAYEKALRYAFWYNGRWNRVEEIASKLRALAAANETVAKEGAQSRPWRSRLRLDASASNISDGVTTDPR